MQVNPLKVIERGIISNIEHTDENDSEYQIAQVGIDLRISKDIELRPKEYQNVELIERFDMQDTLGIIKIRSSLSRRGIFESSGVFDPGFCGIGGISLYNLSSESVSLPKGFRVCQMVIFDANAASQYNGFYNKNKTIDSQYKDKI